MTASQWIVYFVLELTQQRPGIDQGLAVQMGRACSDSGPPEVAAGRCARLSPAARDAIAAGGMPA